MDELWRVADKGHGASFQGDENILNIDDGDGWTTVNILKIITLYS